MKLTNYELVRIFASYIGCSLYLPNAVIINDWYAIQQTQDNEWVFDDIPKLILKSLSNVSDEDAIEVAKILSDQSHKGLFDMDDFGEWMKEILTGNCATYADYVNGYNFIKILDYLRSKSYDLGYSSIPSLIDAGIAVDTKTLNNG